MKKLFLAFCLTSLFATAAHADQAVPAIGLKNKSSFDANEARDPFWPIGWKKPGPTSSTGVAPEILPASFSLTSVTVGAGTHFAILNGKIMQEGQQFRLQSGNQTYLITLRAIEDGRVVLDSQGSEIIVPMRRK